MIQFGTSWRGRGQIPTVEAQVAKNSSLLAIASVLSLSSLSIFSGFKSVVTSHHPANRLCSWGYANYDWLPWRKPGLSSAREIQITNDHEVALGLAPLWLAHISKNCMKFFIWIHLIISAGFLKSIKVNMAIAWSVTESRRGLATQWTILPAKSPLKMRPRRGPCATLTSPCIQFEIVWKPENPPLLHTLDFMMTWFLIFVTYSYIHHCAWNWLGTPSRVANASSFIRTVSMQSHVISTLVDGRIIFEVIFLFLVDPGRSCKTAQALGFVVTTNDPDT